MAGTLATHEARQTGVLTAAHEQFWARARRKFGNAGGTRALIEVLLGAAGYRLRTSQGKRKEGPPAA
jgi:hypothetical protein